MYYYRHCGTTLAAYAPDLPLQPAEAPPPHQPPVFLLDAPPERRQAAFCVSHPRQLTGAEESVSWLDPDRMETGDPEVPAWMMACIRQRTLRAVNRRHPQWETCLRPFQPQPAKKRVHLLAVGDVGGTLLTALKLLGGDCIRSIGICDLSEKTVARWTAEMAQISWPGDYDALPEVEPVAPDDLFDCDVFLFIATKAVPAVGSGVQDVRMAQLEANRPIVSAYAQQARRDGFQGLFVVMSDPVDPLCQAAWQASNLDAAGRWDGLGLRPEQIQGFGLGVMNARAAALARQDPQFASFLTEGRAYGPHGTGLVIANSLDRYDDALSQTLTKQVISANLRIRELGFKPYVAPAISSGAMQLLLTLRGQWHYGSVPLGGVWFGVRNRFTPAGLEWETHPLPDALFARLRETEALLKAIF